MVDTKVVYEHLVETAKGGKTISYHAVGQVIGLCADDPCERMIIGRVLDEISCSENAQGRPMLSAVVVLPEIGYPGKGFFLLARELGLNTYCDDRSFYAHELKRVHEYWKLARVEYPTPVYLPAAHRHSARVPLAVH
jgi:hypothetical protein